MNVKIEDNWEYLKCNNCMIMMTGSNFKIYHSKICLHKLCEPCYTKVFTAENPTYKCTICSKIHELKDYSLKHREDAFYENDYRIRHKLMNV
jgi:hypothetical protein